MSDLFEKLLALELLKRFQEEEDNIYEALTNKHKQLLKVEKEYNELYSSLIKIATINKQIETVLGISNDLNENISDITLNTNNVQMISEILSETFSEYIDPDLNLADKFQELSINDNQIRQVFEYFKRNKYLLTVTTNTARKVDISLKSVAPKTIATLVANLNPEFQ